MSAIREFLSAVGWAVRDAWLLDDDELERQAAERYGALSDDERAAVIAAARGRWAAENRDIDEGEAKSK